MVNENIRIMVFYNGTSTIKIRAYDGNEKPTEFTLDDVFDIKNEPDIFIFKCQFATVFIREDQLIHSAKKGKTRNNMLLLETGLSMPLEDFWKQFKAQHPEDDGLESGLLLKLEIGATF